MTDAFTKNDRAKQNEALRKLEENTHNFWPPQSANAMTDAFGAPSAVRVHKANYDDPKGLHLKDGAAEAEGAASWDISASIVGHVGAKSESKLGRGFQVRADCLAIRQHLGLEE